MKLIRFRSRSAALNLTLVLGVMTHSLSSSVSWLSGPSSMGKVLPRGCTHRHTRNADQLPVRCHTDYIRKTKKLKLRQAKTHLEQDVFMQTL